MPELPEVERVRATLEPRLVGRRLAAVMLKRRDIWTPIPKTGRPAAAEVARQLLAGAVVARLDRRGKQLAVIAEDGRILLVHLGMTGQFFFRPGAEHERDRHVHAWWTVEAAGEPTGELIFRDPRRFGGLWSLVDLEALRERWGDLGPDGLEATGPGLQAALGKSKRAVKAGLLDQAAIAGVGNIYADEALFRARIDPRRRCDRLNAADWDRLAGSIRAVLEAAIRAGGSTLRDYRDGEGRAGNARETHRVYGRGGEPCFECGRALRFMRIAQRTTVFCASCQGRPSR